MAPLLNPFAGKRGHAIGNKIRQVHRFAAGAALSPEERYWRWCGFLDEDQLEGLVAFSYEKQDYLKRKNQLLGPMNGGRGMNDVLYMDMHMVLQNDMLVKVDI